MELMFRTACKILKWVGFIALSLMFMAMIVFGFIGAMVAVAVIAVTNGGDASPIFMILKAVQFLWQFSLVMFLFASLMWAFYLLARHARIKAYQQRQREFEEIKEEILGAVEDQDEMKLNKDYVDLTNFKRKKLRSRRRK